MISRSFESFPLVPKVDLFTRPTALQFVLENDAESSFFELLFDLSSECIQTRILIDAKNNIKDFGSVSSRSRSAYEVRPRKDHLGVDVISDVLPFGRLWYDTPDNAIGYAMHSSRSHDAVIRVYDQAGNIIEAHGHAGDFEEW